MRVLVILGHPSTESYCAAIAETYVEAARQAGAEVNYLKLAEMSFDPVLHRGYQLVQPLEPDLRMAQEAILWAELIVFVYPNWWGGMPALLKGFIDRTLLPGYAFKYRKDSLFWDKYLSGRAARVLMTMDTPPWYYRWVYRMPGHHQIKRTILGFTGIAPVKISTLGPVKTASERKLELWLARVAKLAKKDAG